MGKVTIIVESDDTTTINLTAAVNDILFTESDLHQAILNYQDMGAGRIYVVPSDGD